jgi:hypothetical protein
MGGKSRKNAGRRVAIRGDAGSEFITVYAICSHVGPGDAATVVAPARIEEKHFGQCWRPGGFCFRT